MSNEKPTSVAVQIERSDRRWFDDVKVGDLVIPDPTWNRTELPPNHLTSPTKVLGVLSGEASQSRVMLVVRTKGGLKRSLDAMWFRPFNTYKTTT